MKKTFLLLMIACLALAGSLRAQPSPGIVHDLHDQFDTNGNPSISGWSYNMRLAFGGGLIRQTIDPNWNAGDFGGGQPGYDGVNPGGYAGFAQRIDNGTIGNTPNGNKDAPVGTIVAYYNSALLTIPLTDPGGVANISGNIWNLRQFSRSGSWNVWHNDTTLITSGGVDDTSGTSATPYDITNGTAGAAALLNVPYAPGDTFRFEFLEDDFVGVNFRVTTFTDPYITGQPQSPAVYETGGLLLPPGSSTNLAVVAGGVTALSYQWKLNGTNIPGATSSTLAINNLNINNSGVYTVVVSDTAGHITSTPASVQLNDLYIVTQPLGQSVGYLGSASFSVSGGGTGTLTYQWKLNGTNLVNSTQVSGATTSTLTITNATTNFSGQITVVLGNGTRTITSQAATFTVFRPIPVFPGIAYDLAAQFDTNTTTPSSGWQYCEGLAFDGQNGITPGGYALSTFDPNWNQGDFGAGQPGWDGILPGPWAGWAQRVDNGTIGSTPGGNKDAQVGTVVGYRNSAVWAVPSYLPSGTISLAGGIWNLRHFGRSGVWRIYHNDLNNPATVPLTQSLFNDASGSSTSPFSFERGSGGPAALQNIPYSPGDTFRIDSDEDDFVGWKFTLYVLSDPGMSVPPQSQTVQASNTVTFTVVAAGTAPFTYQWQFNGTNIPGATGTSLVLPNVQTNQSGPYDVVVSNSKGSVTNPPAILNVLADLFIASQPSFQVTNAATGSWLPAGGIFNNGERVFCAVSAGGLGTLSYHWQLNGANLPGQTSSVLTFAAATNLAGAYTCVISNSLGHTLTTAAANLNVNPPIPVFPGAAHDLKSEFSFYSNPTTHGWQYSEGLLFQNNSGVYGGVISQTVDPNWNSPDFGAGQPGWDGVNPGSYAGWAQRVNNGTIDNTSNGNKDASLGDIIGYRNSVLFTIPTNYPAGTANLAGGVWNLRHFGRSGGWNLYMNDATTLSSGTIADNLGSSEGPNSLEAGSGGPSALQNIAFLPGDTFRLEFTEDDFVGAVFTVYTQTDPMITTNPPESITVAGGSTLNITAAASGTTPLSYQWQRNGTNIPGATTATLSLTNITAGSAGSYAMVASNSKGSIASYPEIVSVDPSPLINSARRLLLAPNQVLVVYNKALQPASATNIANYSINNSVSITGATIGSGNTIVTLTLAGNISNNKSYGLTVNNVQDALGTLIAANTQVAISVPGDFVRVQGGDSNHLLVLEAEDYNENLSPSADGHSWIFTNAPWLLQPTDANTNYSGSGVMLADPNTGANNGTSPVGPELSYRVWFLTAGSYNVWVRGVGDSSPGPSQNDSIQIGIDGVLTTLLTGFPQGQGYAWGNSPVAFSGPIVVSTPGLHVINVWMREDGFAFDKLLLTSSSTYTPFGIDAAESQLAGPAIAVGHSGGNLLLGWNGPGTLQTATNAAGPYTDILGAPNPYPVTPSGAKQFFRVRP